LLMYLAITVIAIVGLRAGERAARTPVALA